MASTSASSIQKMAFKYDVFISFRGEDTRKNFVDNLYQALKRNGIYAYRDDEEIRKGRGINDELMRSIENSRYYVVVFSKNYASSSWCLKELVKIMECQKTGEHIVYPVFYDVEPTEVRKQSWAVEKAFKKRKVEEAVDDQNWREALRQAAGLAGWELKNTCDGHEGKFIQKIVQAISLELRFTNFSIDEKLVGMGTRVEEVVSSLEIGGDDVRIIGIKGMGGAGKTTLARAVFDHISFEFEGSSFVENVRERSKESLCGLTSLQTQVLSEVLKTQDITISGVCDGKEMMKRRMCGIKVLVVLDDVDHRKQLQALAGGPEWFKSGSRIIITTRDEQVLIEHKVPKHLILDAKFLSPEEAIRLLSRYAFGRETPMQGYEKLSYQVIHYANGLPLTIEVLGSNLCGKDELEWTDELERLEKIPLKETLEILELSYNSLEDEHKEIFLDVACMMKGWKKEEAIRALECRLFHARIGLRVLELKSLITVSDIGCLGMHDHIEEMGKNIVRRAHPDVPYKHSRLWIEDDIKSMLDEDKDNEETRCIKVQMVEPAIVMKVLRKMKKLRYLDVICGNKSNFVADNSYFYLNPNAALDYDDHIDEDSLHLPHGLQYLRWYGYPFTCLPKNFEANNLVGIKIHFSKMDQLWEVGERKVLKQLRFLDLSRCELRSLDVGLIPNLEILSLEKCHKLVELPLPNSKLRCLNLYDSWLIRTLDLEHAPNLVTLEVQECDNLTEIRMPVECLKLKHLKVTSCYMLKTLNLMRALNLEMLYLECNDLVELHVPKNFNLKSLTLNRSKLKTLDIAGAQHLDELCIKDNVYLVELHFHVEKLQRLQLLHSPIKTLNLKQAQNLEVLNISDFWHLQELHMPTESPKLKTIKLHCSKLPTLDLSGTQNLKRLDLEQCNNLLELHMLDETPELENIKVQYCSKLSTLDLSRTRNLKNLDLEQCDDLLELHIPNECPGLETIKVQYCSKLPTLDLSCTQNLKRLHLENCNDLLELLMPNETLELKTIEVRYCSKLPTLDLSGIRNLKQLYLKQCDDLLELHLPNECSKLEIIKVQYCSKLPTLDLSETRNLKNLYLQQCDDLLELHMSNECLGLEAIKLQYCSKLPTLDLSGTQNLKRLHLEKCNDLLELLMPNETPKLKTIEVQYCSKLPALDLSGTQNLKWLHLEKCNDLLELLMPNETSELKTIEVQYCSKLLALDLSATQNLKWLHLEKCNGLLELLMPNETPELETIEVQYCSKLPTLDLSGTRNLKKLNLEQCHDLLELHMSNECPGLETIKVQYCSKVPILDLSGTRNLKRLDLEQCDDLLELHMPDETLELESINVHCSKLKTFKLGISPHLECFDLSGCFTLEKISAPIGCLSSQIIFKPCFLNKGFPMVEFLPELHLVMSPFGLCPLHPHNNQPKFHFQFNYKELLPSSTRNLENLISFGLCACTNLAGLPGIICVLQCLRKLTLEGSIPELPEEIDQLECLEELTLLSTEIEHLPDSICTLNHLKFLRLESCCFLKQLPENIGRLECLEELTLLSTKIEYLPDSICTLNHLKFLRLESCCFLKQLPENIGILECLEELTLLSIKIEYLPDSICTLNHLKFLRLESCCFLKQLPEDIGRLECLEELHLTDCTSLRNIPNSICEMKRLNSIHLRNCTLVEKLPKEIGRLKCLEQLHIKGTGITDLPESIYQLEDLQFFV